MRSSRFSWLLLGLLASAPAPGADEIPDDLVVDVRVFEARSASPDFKAMEELAFFISTDGGGVSEDQWLATIALRAPDSFLATLAFESIPLDSPMLALELEKRSRTLKLTADFSEFVAEGVFHADVRGELLRSDELQRSFQRTIEAHVGQTYVWSGRGMELSASEYLSHFRDYRDSDDRGDLYEGLRNYATFLIIALTPRLTGSSRAPEVVSMDVPDGAEIPTIQSPIGIDLVGTVLLDVDIDADGTPTDIRIVRSSIPEANSQILDAVAGWSFPDDGGTTGRLTLELKASR